MTDDTDDDKTGLRYMARMAEVVDQRLPEMLSEQLRAFVKVVDEEFPDDEDAPQRSLDIAMGRMQQLIATAHGEVMLEIARERTIAWQRKAARRRARQK